MLSVISLQRRVASSIFSNIQKCNLHYNLCVSGTFHSHMIFAQRTDHFLKDPHIYSLITIRLMAGHSKWQNIQHIKAAKDRQKTLASNKFAYLIRIAARDGGKDPKFNHKLANVLEQARKKNVAMSTIENALKADNKKTKYGSAELLGPGGCILVVEYETDNVSTIRHDIKVVCKKYGAHVLSGEGRWRSAYEKKGIVKAVGKKDGQTLDAEKALDDAILAGAEEVLTREEDNKLYFEFLCSTDDLNPVKKEIERNYEVEEGYVGFLPIAPMELSKTDMILFENLLEDLGNLSDIVKIYENVQ